MKTSLIISTLASFVFTFILVNPSAKAEENDARGTFEFNVSPDDANSRLRELKRAISGLKLVLNGGRKGAYSKTLVLSAPSKHWDKVFEVLPKEGTHSETTQYAHGILKFLQNEVPVNVVLSTTNGQTFSHVFAFEHSEFETFTSLKDISASALKSLKESKNNNDINIAARTPGAKIEIAKGYEYSFPNLPRPEKNVRGKRLNTKRASRT